MHPRLYRLIEAHRRIDDALRREQSRPLPDWVALLRLRHLKHRAKTLIRRFTLRVARGRSLRRVSLGRPLAFEA